VCNHVRVCYYAIYNKYQPYLIFIPVKSDFFLICDHYLPEGCVKPDTSKLLTTQYEFAV